MAALRFIETLALLAAAIVTFRRARPASPPYGWRMARIGLLLALELGVLYAFVVFQLRTRHARSHVLGHHDRVRSGDTLIVYSDGITEAQASGKDLADGARDAAAMYGEERLADLAQSHRGAPARVLLDALMESVQSFARGAPQADDITIAIVRRVPRAIGA